MACRHVDLDEGGSGGEGAEFRTDEGVSRESVDSRRVSDVRPQLRDS